MYSIADINNKVQGKHVINDRIMPSLFQPLDFQVLVVNTKWI